MNKGKCFEDFGACKEGDAFKCTGSYSPAFTEGNVYKVDNCGEIIDNDCDPLASTVSTFIREYPNPPPKPCEVIKAWADGADIQAWYEGICSSIHQHCDLIKAWADGANIQVWYDGVGWTVDGWVDEYIPNWHHDSKYRIKPRKGIEKEEAVEQDRKDLIRQTKAFLMKLEGE